MKLTRLQRAAFVLGVLALLALSFPSRTDLGWSFIATRDYARALAVLEPLTKRGNVSRDTWEALAAAWAGLGVPERQITALEAAAGAAPGDRELMLRLADVYEAAKDIEGTARTLDRLVAERPQDEASLQRLLGLYDWLGRYADASRILSKVLALDIRRPDLAQDVMNVARMLDRADDAIPSLERYAAARAGDA
ncbi:MAG TPA: tetratricopeptide repeat protein, partial [Terriglobales bacterium]|nr:tetratricopeptide repeat protein [Terriglobales bacterium]